MLFFCIVALSTVITMVFLGLIATVDINIVTLFSLLYIEFITRVCIFLSIDGATKRGDIGIFTNIEGNFKHRIKRVK